LLSITILLLPGSHPLNAISFVFCAGILNHVLLLFVLIYMQLSASYLLCQILQRGHWQIAALAVVDITQ
jgi:hypothetical protein